MQISNNFAHIVVSLGEYGPMYGPFCTLVYLYMDCCHVRCVNGGFLHFECLVGENVLYYSYVHMVLDYERYMGGT